MRDRTLRLRQVLPCLRHDLRRGSAPLRRVALGVRAPVPADDGEARRRFDRRPLAGDLDRPEDHLPEPALDRRHGDGDLRLPAASLRARGAAALSDLRSSDRRTERPSHRRPGSPPAGGDEVHGERTGRPGPEGRVQGPPRALEERGLHARQGRRRAEAPRRGDRARQEVQAHDRGRGRPARDQAGPAPPPHGLGRDRARPGRPARGDRHHRRRDDDLLGALRLPRAWGRAPGAPAAHLQLQLPARGVPALHGPRLAAAHRPGPARARSDRVGRRRRARPLVRW